MTAKRTPRRFELGDEVTVRGALPAQTQRATVVRVYPYDPKTVGIRYAVTGAVVDMKVARISLVRAA